MGVCESVNVKSKSHSIVLEDLKVATPEGRWVWVDDEGEPEIEMLFSF